MVSAYFNSWISDTIMSLKENQIMDILDINYYLQVFTTIFRWKVDDCNYELVVSQNS